MNSSPTPRDRLVKKGFSLIPQMPPEGEGWYIFHLYFASTFYEGWAHPLLEATLSLGKPVGSLSYVHRSSQYSCSLRNQLDFLRQVERRLLFSPEFMEVLPRVEGSIPVFVKGAYCRPLAERLIRKFSQPLRVVSLEGVLTQSLK